MYENANHKTHNGIWIQKLNSNLKKMNKGLHVKNTYIHGLDLAKVDQNSFIIVWGEHGHKI